MTYELTRTPLLLALIEWEDEERRWKKAQKRLKSATRKIQSRIDRKMRHQETRGPREGESPAEFGTRLLDKEDQLRTRLFQRKQKKLNKLQAKETRRFGEYVAADRLRPERVVVRTPSAVIQQGSRVVRPRKMFPTRRAPRQ